MLVEEAILRAEASEEVGALALLPLRAEASDPPPARAIGRPARDAMPLALAFKAATSRFKGINMD